MTLGCPPSLPLATMKPIDVKPFVGHIARLQYEDRAGCMHTLIATIYDLGYLSYHGHCLITSEGEIRLDRVQMIEPLGENSAA